MGGTNSATYTWVLKAIHLTNNLKSNDIRHNVLMQGNKHIFYLPPPTTPPPPMSVIFEIKTQDPCLEEVGILTL